jgi:hypothetical protein
VREVIAHQAGLSREVPAQRNGDQRQHDDQPERDDQE